MGVSATPPPERTPGFVQEVLLSSFFRRIVSCDCPRGPLRSPLRFRETPAAASPACSRCLGRAGAGAPRSLHLLRPPLGGGLPLGWLAAGACRSWQPSAPFPPPSRPHLPWSGMEMHLVGRGAGLIDVGVSRGAPRPLLWHSPTPSLHCGCEAAACPSRNNRPQNDFKL